MSKHQCPRRSEAPGPRPLRYSDEWREDDSCSYCGSLHPDIFMARLEAEDVELTPTDKPYKVYVSNDGGDWFKQTHTEGSDWLTSMKEQAKFYFQHLDDHQRHRFVELYNSGKIKMTFPGYFYVLPFFSRPPSKECES